MSITDTMLSELGQVRRANDDADFEQAADRRAVLKLYEGKVAHTELTIGEMRRLLKMPEDRVIAAVQTLLRREYPKARLVTGIRELDSHDRKARVYRRPVP